MPVVSHFLGWNAPLATAVGDYLLEDAAERPVDLSRVLVLVPTRQAGRRLRESLARRCVGLLSPRVIAPRELLRFRQVPRPVAPPSLVAAVWCRVLREADLESLTTLFPSSGPVRDSSWLLQTGALLDRLRLALAEGGHSIVSLLRDHEDQLVERDRWRELGLLELAYGQTMDRLEWSDPVQADLLAAAEPGVPPDYSRVVVAGVPDLSPLVASALARLPSVEVLVHAPPDRAGMFDAWGRPVPEAWAGEPIPIAEDDLFLAGSPAGQSRIVMELLSDPADAAVGVPDSDVTPFLASALAERGWKSYDPAGRPIADHPVHQLLESVRRLVNEGGYDAFAQIARHVDVLEGLNVGAEALAQLDEFQNEYLPEDFDAIASRFRGDRAAAQTYPSLFKLVRFAAQTKERFSERNLDAALRELFAEVYAGRMIRPGERRDDEFIAVARLVTDAMSELAGDAVLRLGLSAREALDVLAARLAGERFYPDRSDAALDLEGWLELVWSEAPNVIVTGLNEGIVPDARVSDIFLPDRQRAALLLPTEAQRAARDAFLLRSLIASRESSGRVALICGRTTSAGDPLRPSRLLFRCGDDALVPRAEKLFRPAPEPREHAPAQISFRLDPNVPDRRAIEKLRVTQFRDYLACPFRFYLGHVLGMEEQDDRKTELDDLDFGTLLHLALQRLKDDPAGRSTDEHAIAGLLVGTLDDLIADRFGSDPTLQIVIQQEAGRQRLRAAARIHAQSVAEGWEIVETEYKVRGTLGGLEVSGTVDRMERNRRTGLLRILDYKTSDKADRPDAKHLASAGDETPAAAQVSVGDRIRRWVDLQLPLYAVLAACDDAPWIGYFNLPKAVRETGISLWPDFDANLMASARTCAEWVASQVRGGVFWPPADRVRYDDFEHLLFDRPSDYVLEPKP